MVMTDNIKSFFNGALGAVTFGAYHLYIMNYTMENNNKTMTTRLEMIEKENERQYKKLQEENDSLKTKIMEMQRSRTWF